MTENTQQPSSGWSSPNRSQSQTLLDKLGSSQADKADKAALDQLDAELGSIISNLSASSNNNNYNTSTAFEQNSDSRRNSASYASSDVDSDFGPFGLRRTTLSLGGFNQNSSSRLQNTGFGSTSLSGGIPTHTPSAGSGRFLEKFSAVAEATREVELLGGGLGSLSIGNTSARVPTSRRTSFLTTESSAATSKPFLESSPGSLNESLNASLNNPVSTRQSISDRIDSYLSNANSPNQQFKNGNAANRAMSISSDVTKSDHESLVFEDDKVNTSIWNTASVASTATFTPMFNQNQQNFQFNQQQIPPQGYPQMFPPYGFFNQPFPMMPMIPPQFQNGFPPSPMQQAHNSNESESKEALPSSGETEAPSTSAGNNGPHHPQPQLPQPGFDGNGPSFIYPQTFSPYGFIPPQLTEQIPPAPFNPLSPPDNNGHHHQSKRNGRPVKSPSPNGHGNPRANGKGPKNQIYRSPLLEEFRNNTEREFRLKDIFGSAIEFSKDQHGSRFIQQELESSSPAEKEVIFNEIREVAMELMNDVFGNYVIQKYFEHGDDTQKKVLLTEMKGNIKSLSLQMYGCRVVQRAIEYVGVDDQVDIVLELKDSVLPCIKDQNGNHVIQKAIEKIPINKIDFILENLKTQIYHLSTHPYGCRVIQRLLEYSKAEDQEFILEELSKFTYFLIQDQYGNYVIQHIIQHGALKDKKVIVDTVAGSVVEFSKHKFASNVVEKCVVYGTEEQKNLILDEILQGNDKDDDSAVDDRSPLGLMMKDQFANYVVQKLVEVAKGQKKKILVKKIRQSLNQISKSSFGKHLASIDKLIQLAETAITSDDEE